MPHDIRVITAREFLRADLHGRIDLATSKRIFEEMARACAAAPGRHVLLDVRDATGEKLTSVDLYELVQSLCGLGLGVLNRIAIVRVPRDTFDRARFFEL